MADGSDSRYALQVGDKIPVTDGGHAVVLDFIASGGQGIVYRVDYQGRELALKWYFYNRLKNPGAFRNNLLQNVRDGAPEQGGRFLWPRHVTEYVMVGGRYKTFGYLMDLAPSGYVVLEKLYMQVEYEKPQRKGMPAVRREYRFADLDAQVTAGIHIVQAFRSLHLAGKSYQDINLGGFFVDPQTGDVLICDCDNVAPDGQNFGIGGMPGFMAPEVVRGAAAPDVLTDRYSLANVLFRLLMRADPLEGKRVVQSVVLTEQNDLKYYGKEPVFIWDPEDMSNRPVVGIHDNAIKMWKLYPEYIRKAFIKSFTEDIRNPNGRIIEKKWQKLLIRLRADIIHCTCGKVTYSNCFKRGEHFVSTCTKCGSKIHTLQVNGILAPVYPGMKLYRCYTEAEDDYETVTGIVLENQKKKGVYGIKNMSGRTWKALFPDGMVREVAPQSGVPVWKDLVIDFGGRIGGRILS